MSQSELERTFETIWKQLGGPELETEYQFHPTRKWRFDYAFVSAQIKAGFEIEGGTFKGGRHTRGKGYAQDCQKYNQAQLLGFQVYRFTADMLESDPAGHLQPIIELMKR
jgi:very-short-patch-repair endonuclease